MDFNVRNKKILAVGAHADDIDFGCAGSFAKWVKEGAEIYYLILTDGSKGSEDLSINNEQLITMRQQEQKKAAKILGAKYVFFLQEIDGELQNTLELRKEIVRIIRSVKPDIVISWDPTYFYSQQAGYINHPDHRVAGQATLEAVFPYSRNIRSFPELLDEGLELHKVSEVLLMNRQDADFFIDISDTMDDKIEALSCHKSQFENFDDVIKRVKERAAKMGQKAKCKYAEGFIRIVISS